MSATLLKLGGHKTGDEAWLNALGATVRGLEPRPVIVHGGGPELSRLQERLGIRPQFHQGVRVTDAESLSLAEMALCGTVNKRLVRALLAAGVDALGLSGMDRGLVRAQPMRHGAFTPGYTGAVREVRTGVLRDLLAQGVTPVVAPLCLGPGSALNVNADHVACAIAVALEARRIVFLTNVAGVRVDGHVLRALAPACAEELIAQGSIHGGMIPKVRMALQALRSGVPEAVITDLEGLRVGTGTVFRDAAVAGETEQGESER